MNTNNFQLHLEKQLVLETLTKLLPNVGLLSIENASLSDLYITEAFPINLIVKAYFGEKNYSTLEAYLKHNIFDSQIFFEVCQYFKTMDDVCEYLILLQHFFYCKPDRFEFFTKMAFIFDVEEITNIHRDIFIVKKGIDTIGEDYTLGKHSKNSYLELKNSYFELQNNIDELNLKVAHRYSYLKLKRFIKTTTPISICCN